MHPLVLTLNKLLTIQLKIKINLLFLLSMLLLKQMCPKAFLFTVLFVYPFSSFQIIIVSHNNVFRIQTYQSYSRFFPLIRFPVFDLAYPGGSPEICYLLFCGSHDRATLNGSVLTTEEKS